VFGLFKKPTAAAAPPVLDQLAFSAAVFKVATKYVTTEKKLPISKDENATIIDTWIGTRLEAIAQLNSFGALDLQLITDPSKHPLLLESFVGEADNSMSVAFFTPRKDMPSRLGYDRTMQHLRFSRCHDRSVGVSSVSGNRLVQSEKVTSARECVIRRYDRSPSGCRVVLAVPLKLDRMPERCS
jgi:hypothetical protein